MKSRLSKLRSLMIKRHFDALLISSLPDITYLTNFSHFSKHEREAFLFITFNKQYVLTDGRYAEAVKNHMRNQILSLPKYELIEISSNRTFEKALKDLAKKHKIKRLGIEENNLTVKEHKALLSSRLSQASPGAWRDLLHHSLDSLRVIKNASEISAIEKACNVGDKTFKYILNKIKHGVTERQLAFEIEFFIKKAGGDISFPPIVAFGANSAIPHHKSSNTPLLSARHSGERSDSRISYRSSLRDSGQARMTSGQFVLLDFGAKIDNYCSDMTRTVFFGKPTPKQKRMYQTVLEAQKKAIQAFSHLGRWRGNDLDSSEVNSRDIKAKDIDKVTRNYILEKGFPTTPHSLGHGIGLEVHEAPRLSPKSKDILKPGMVFTIEPGIYLPGFGGVRIEDVVVLDKTGPRLLTKSTKEIIKIA